MTPQPPASDSPLPDANPGGEEPAPIVLPIEEVLDLHTFAPRDIADLVAEYLEQCARRGIREVRLIHGRGSGAQRRTVRAVVERHPLVSAFADAPPERGGWGATVVHLRVDPTGQRDPGESRPCVPE